MLSVKNLSKVYKVGGRVVVPVNHLTFDVAAGNILCLIGPNGAGKTTTVKMLCGLILPSSGEIYFNSISAKSGKKYLKYVSAVLEGARNIYWRLTPKENVEYAARIKETCRTNSKKRTARYLEMLDLGKHQNTECRYLSRGNQQKVAIACALVPETELLLLDEPTLGLDLEMAQKVMKMIEQEKRYGRQIIITTHNMELVEGVADQVAIFRDGNAVFIPELSKMIFQYAQWDRRLSTAYLNYIRELDHEHSIVTYN